MFSRRFQWTVIFGVTTAVPYSIGLHLLLKELLVLSPRWMWLLQPVLWMQPAMFSGSEWILICDSLVLVCGVIGLFWLSARVGLFIHTAPADVLRVLFAGLSRTGKGK